MNRSVRRRHNVVGTPYDGAMAGLERSARKNLKGPPVYLNVDQANVLLGQSQETAQVRGWELEAIAIMRNHIHLVAGAPQEIGGDKLLKDFKAYGSRALNRKWPRPKSGTWWTESGSRRRLPGDRAARAAVRYVIRQSNPLLVWAAEHWKAKLEC